MTSNEPVQATAAAPFAIEGQGDSLLLGFVLAQCPAAVPDFLRWASKRAANYAKRHLCGVT